MSESFSQRLNNMRWAWAVLSFVSGCVAALALAPLFWWPLYIIGVSCLYISISNSRSGVSRFWRGWLFGLGYFVSGLYWIGNALLVEGNPYAWAWPLAVLALPALLSFFTGFAALVAGTIASLRSLAGFLFFTATFSLFEWLRGHIFTGFPWNLPGYIWGDTLEIAQAAALSDIYGLSLITFFAAAAPGFIVLNYNRHRITSIGLSIFSLLIFSALFIYGHMRLASNPTAYHKDIEVRVVQPNVLQHEKWDRSLMAAHFRRHLDLSLENTGRADPDKQIIIVWPETAISHHFLTNPLARRDIDQMLQAAGGQATLLSGALRYTPEDKTYANSLIQINPESPRDIIYDKHHLVPFGEYIPFQNYIPLKPVVQFTGFVPGPGSAVFRLPPHQHKQSTLSYLPLICYEAIFSRHAIYNNGETPDFLVNVTNDAWYGLSPGPYQHYVQARFRAIETGVPLVRAANTGISAVTDAFGREIAAAGLFTQTSLTVNLPASFKTFPLETKRYIFIAGLILLYSLGTVIQLSNQKN